MYSTKKLLIVDDEVDIRTLCRAVIHRYFKLEVFQTDSIEKAYTLIKQENIDFILLDLYLPDGWGLDLIKKMKKEDMNVDFLIISAHSQNKEEETAYEMGAHAFIKKPFQSAQLVAALKKMIENK